MNSYPQNIVFPILSNQENKYFFQCALIGYDKGNKWTNSKVKFYFMSLCIQNRSRLDRSHIAGWGLNNATWMEMEIIIISDIISVHFTEACLTWFRDDFFFIQYYLLWLCPEVFYTSQQTACSPFSQWRRKGPDTPRASSWLYVLSTWWTLSSCVQLYPYTVCTDIDRGPIYGG